MFLDSLKKIFFFFGIHLLSQVTELWQILRTVVTFTKSWECLELANPGEMWNYIDDERFKQSELFQPTLFPGNSNN